MSVPDTAATMDDTAIAMLVRKTLPRTSGFYGEMTPGDAQTIVTALREAGLLRD